LYFEITGTSESGFTLSLRTGKESPAQNRVANLGILKLTHKRPDVKINRLAPFDNAFEADVFYYDKKYGLVSRQFY
jgi:hypothetical protein